MRGLNLFKTKNMNQFMRYLIVGGTATVVEWGLFWVFVYPLKWDQNLGFIVAYILSTFVNLIFGRHFAFKSAVANKGLRAFLRESSLVYIVAAVSCILNVLLLNFFTIVFNMDSMLAKVVTTGIVFIFNFLARKLGIYRERKPTEKMSL